MNRDESTIRLLAGPKMRMGSQPRCPWCDGLMIYVRVKEDTEPQLVRCESCCGGFWMHKHDTVTCVYLTERQAEMMPVLRCVSFDKRCQAVASPGSHPCAVTPASCAESCASVFDAGVCAGRFERPYLYLCDEQEFPASWADWYWPDWVPDDMRCPMRDLSVSPRSWFRKLESEGCPAMGELVEIDAYIYGAGRSRRTGRFVPLRSSGYVGIVCEDGSCFRGDLVTPLKKPYLPKHGNLVVVRFLLGCVTQS